MNHAAIIIVASSILLIVGSLTIIRTARDAHEEKLDRMCNQLKQESKWGYLAPPMETDDVWMAREKAKAEVCAARRSSGEPD